MLDQDLKMISTFQQLIQFKLQYYTNSNQYSHSDFVFVFGHSHFGCQPSWSASSCHFWPLWYVLFHVFSFLFLVCMCHALNELQVSLRLRTCQTQIFFIHFDLNIFHTFGLKHFSQIWTQIFFMNSYIDLDLDFIHTHIQFVYFQLFIKHLYLISV